MTTYIHHRITCAPRRWQEVAESLARPDGATAAAGGAGATGAGTLSDRT